MTKCIPIGWIKENGECAIFTEINDNGLILLECGDIEWVPAVCPDSDTNGVLKIGPVSPKISSVDGTVTGVNVQRDGGGSAFAVIFGIDVDPCDHLGSRMAEKIVAVGNGDGANDPGGGIASTLRLRGHGDLVANGGTETTATVGFLDIFRRGTQDGIAEYVNTGTGNNAGHLFRILDITGPVYQDLMELSPIAGTLYFPSWTYVSDERLKSEIQELDGQAALGIVMGISPIAYAMNGRRYHGFSAQNVQTVLPDAVNEPASKDKPYTMRESDIVANLVAAVKYLTAEVRELKAKVG